MAAQAKTRLVVGCMTGTSLDGLDAVLTRIEGEGLEMRAAFVRMASRPLGALGEMLRSLAEGEPHPASDFMRAARALGELHAEVVSELVGDEKIDFVVAHGQTIFHAGGEHLSWQLFDPWPVVKRCGVPVCYDLRQADLVAGGQGAPITPIADWVMYREPKWHRAVVNLGGICNVTHLDEELPKSLRIGGCDIGPCNLLIDGVTRVLFPQLPYDIDGRIASQGRPHDEFQQLVYKHSPFYQRGDWRSTGREDFGRDVISAIVRDAVEVMKPEDVVASAVDLVVREIDVMAVSTKTWEVVLAGGGTKNPVLVDRLMKLENTTVNLSSFYDIPCEAREAMGFAVLGALSRDGVPITLPKVTGSDNPGVAGTWVHP